MSDLSQIIGVTITELPNWIAFIKAQRAHADPSAPSMTDAEALAILHVAVTSTIAKDDAWLASRPSK